MMNAEAQRNDDDWINEFLDIGDKTNPPKYPSLSVDEIFEWIDQSFQNSPGSIIDNLMDDQPDHIYPPPTG